MAFRRSRIPAALAALTLALALPGCIGLFGGDEDQFPASLGILAGLLTGSPPVVPLIPGSPVDLDGDGNTDGTVIDSDGNGVADGVDTNGDGVPEIGLVDSDGDGLPDAIDINGDGSPDYWICFENGVRRIKTAPGCSGNNATLIDSNDDGTPDGIDTDGDGTINDGTLAAIAGDSTPPIVSIDIAAGTYGTAQLVRITCADAIAPGTIAYTLDGSAPAFSSGGASTLAAPPSTQALIGASGDGAYTLRYTCRDAAGNTAAPQTAAYTIDSNVPSITFQSVASAFVSNAGGIASSNITWRSNRTGNYSVRHSAANCTSGTAIATGSATANVDVVTNISAATHFAGAGARAFLFCVVDTGNGLTGSGSQTITRDDTAPTLSLSPGTGNYSSIQSVTASCSDASSGCDKIAYSYGTSNPTDPAINATTGAVTSGTQYASALTPSDDVVNFYEFRARDNAGNVTSVQAQTLTISTGVSNITVNSFDGTISGGASAFNWQSDRPGSYSVRIGGTDCTNGSAATGTNVSGSIAAATPVSTSITNGNFSGGANTVRLCVENLLGNFGSTTRTVTKDTTAPTVSIDAPTTAGPHVANTQLTLSAADTGGTGVQRIAYTTDGNDPAFSGANCSVTTGTQYTAAVTLANGSYTVKARSCDNAGNVSTVASLALSVGPPGTPTISSATPGNAQVSIAFSAVSGATSYRVYYKTSAGVTTSDSFATGTSSPIVVSSLTNGTTYYFRLAAIHGGGESGLSGESSATPSALAAPTSVQAFAGNSLATITWATVSGATSYTLYWSTSSGVTTSSSQITGISSPPYAHTSLTNGVTVYYRVAANDGAGDGALSSEVSATPTAAALRIFVSNTSLTGNMGGLSGADATCNADSGRPDTSKTYKALLAGNNALQPNRAYVASSNGGAALGTTTSGAAFNLPLPNSPGSSFSNVWTGGNGQNCTGWTSTSGNGGTGFDGSTTATWFTDSGVTCSVGRKIYCAEQ